MMRRRSSSRCSRKLIPVISDEARSWAFSKTGLGIGNDPRVAVGGSFDRWMGSFRGRRFGLGNPLESIAGDAGAWGHNQSLVGLFRGKNLLRLGGRPLPFLLL